jgi:hypothetical protein
MFDSGWSKFMLKPGHQVTVAIRQVKDRKFVGPIDEVSLADGRGFGKFRNEKPAS